MGWDGSELAGELGLNYTAQMGHSGLSGHMEADSLIEAMINEFNYESFN